MDFDKFAEKYFDENDNTGFNDMLLQRQFKLKSLKERLKKYRLSAAEIDKLFEIIIKAEMEMEKVKRSFNSKKYTEKDLDNLYDKLVAIQNKMKEDFEKSLNKLLKEKYEKAKKILEEREKKNK